MLLVLNESEEISKKHRNGNLSYRRNVKRSVFLDIDVKVLFAGKVDTDCTVLEMFDGELVSSAGNTRNDNIRVSDGLSECDISISNLVTLVLETLATGVLLGAGNINGVHSSTVIGQQGRERTTNDFTSIDDGDGLTVESVTVGDQGIIHAEVLEDLDHSQGRAGQNTLLGLGLIEKADIVVHVLNVDVT